MSTTSREQQAHASREAVNRMNELGIEPTPDNYHVFYTAYLGDKTIARALLKAVESDPKNRQREIDAIHADHLAPQVFSDAMMRIGDKLGSAVSDMKGITATAAEASGNFEGALGQFVSSLGRLTDPEEIVQAVRSLMSSALQMARRNASMSRKLSRMEDSLSSLKGEMDSIKRDFFTDPLTGVGNRRFLDAYLADLISGERGRRRTVVCMIDVDHFKAFNDKWGHPTGDLVLKQVARVVTKKLGERGVVTRYGGEEFAVILHDMDMKAASKAVDDIRQTFADTPMIKQSTGENLGILTASFGLAALAQNDSIESVLGRADANLYRAKKAGRNRIVSENDDVAEVAEMVGNIRTILDTINGDAEPGMRV